MKSNEDKATSPPPPGQAPPSSRQAELKRQRPVSRWDADAGTAKLRAKVTERGDDQSVLFDYVSRPTTPAMAAVQPGSGVVLIPVRPAEDEALLRRATLTR